MIRLLCTVLILLSGALTITSTSNAAEPSSLMERIAPWRYPGSTSKSASMSDAATVNASGNRTIQSIQCKTVMTTNDSVAKVVKYYKSKLDSEAADASKPLAIKSARSVTLHDDSEDRPLAIEMLMINTDTTSTTLVISRGKDEVETHIAWTQYIKFE